MKRPHVQTSKRPNGAPLRGVARPARSSLDVWTFGRLDVSIRRAFTLVESITAITVLAILGSIASFILFPAVAGHSRAAAEAQLHTELSLALDRIERELRAIKLDPNAEGIAPDIASISPSSITWHDNWSLFLSGSELRLVEEGGSPRVLLHDVTAFSVQAFDESNVAMGADLVGSACDPVRRLRIAITLEREGVLQTLRAKVFLRSTVEKAGT